MHTNSFPRKERLKKNDSIKTVFDKGRHYRARSLSVYILKRAVGEGLKPSPTNRAAIVCKKSLHNKSSILRNRIKRVLREAYRKTKHILPSGHDIVILGTDIDKNTKPGILEKELTDVFKKHIKK